MLAWAGGVRGGGRLGRRGGGILNPPTPCPRPFSRPPPPSPIRPRFPGRTLIFVNSIASLRRLTALLTALRLPVTSLHAGMQQRQRLAHLDQFRSKPTSVLVATDVAARGLDIPDVAYVLHYSLPATAEVFVHRSGRTARALTDGLALALVGPEDQRQYAKIMGVLGIAAGLPDFPVDDRCMRAVVGRMSIARRLAEETERIA